MIRISKEEFQLAWENFREKWRGWLRRNKYLFFFFDFVYFRFRFFVSLFFLGKRFECPFCQGHFRKFFSYGAKIPILKEKEVIGGAWRKNALCPRCSSKDRERLIYLYLKKKTAIFSQKLKLLHVAPERNLQRVLKLSSNIDYFSVDLLSPLAQAKMDIAHLPIKDNTFDVIICSHVLEHIPEDKRAISELFRVLKPGGWAILQVPISLVLKKTLEDPSKKTFQERKKAFGHRYHVRIYGQDYPERLKSQGFLVKVYSPKEFLSPKEIEKYALIKEEKLFICFKPK